MVELLACRACLGVEVKMYTMLYTDLLEYFQQLIGINLEQQDGKPHHICSECRSHLVKCHRFKEQCLRSEQLLTQLQISQLNLTTKSIKALNKPNKFITLQSSGIVQHAYNPCEEVTIKLEVDLKKDLEDVEEADYAEEASVDDNGESTDTDSDDIPLKDIAEKEILADDSHLIQDKKPKPKRGFHEDYAVEIHLTMEQQLEEMVQRSNSDNYKSCPYKCELCFRGFVDNAAFVNHLVKHDQKTGKFECELCHMRYPHLRQLRTHLSTSHTRHYACKKCQHTSHTANQAREHEKWHRGFLYECKLCSETFRKPTSHLTHMRKRHPTEFICELCGDSFVGKHGLLMHRTKTHQSVTENKSIEKNPESHCSDCEVQFVSQEAWKRHIVTSSRHTRDLMCKICKQKSLTNGDIVTHYKIHLKELKIKQDPSERPQMKVNKMQCDQCESKFVNRSKLHAHVRRKHLGMKYNKHIVCEVCGKKCTSNATLKYHQRTHTGERPYSCTECPKRFSDNNQLKIHNRTHTDERPYQCDVCSKTFRQKPALNRHFRVHTGVKPYECQYCSKQFSQSNSLKLHIRTVHLKLPANRRKQAMEKNVESTAVLQIL